MSTTVSYKGNTITAVSNTTKILDTEGKYLEADIILTDNSTPTLQTKNVTYTPSTSRQTAQVTADNGYDGLQEVDVTVNAMPQGAFTVADKEVAPVVSIDQDGRVYIPSENLAVKRNHTWQRHSNAVGIALCAC